MSQVMVVKHDGAKEPYDENKIRASASRVGVPITLQNQMISAVRSRLYDGIKTQDIFTIIQSYLRTSPSPYLASKYNLKSALTELGPSGYPFEQFVANLLQAKDYDVRTNEVWAGGCVTHEIDVIATKRQTTWTIEAKFHKNESQRTDVRVALYIYARYLDLKAGWQGSGELMPWIVTNTRFSTDAIKYARCQNIKLTSWGYPNGDGIMDMIETTSLHPLTMLESLSPSEKKFLIANHLLFVKDLVEPANAHLLPAHKKDYILDEARGVFRARRTT